MSVQDIEQQRQLFKNEDGGFIGAVQIGPEGKPVGVAVPPGGHVWLSEVEQRLTANAPVQAKDNPFVAQTRVVTDRETGVMSEIQVTPLVAVSDTRFVPGVDRHIPGIVDDPLGDAPDSAPPPQTPSASKVVPNPSETAPRVPARAAAAVAGQPATPAMQGLTPPADVGGGFDDADPVGVTPGAAPAVTQGAKMNGPQSEEHAAKVDPAIGEETGAAAKPTGDAPQGHYQASEEVGTPTAPTAPPPYVPPED
jgi:hypothetical protein